MTNYTVGSYSLEDVSDGDGTATTLLFGEKAGLSTSLIGQGYDIQMGRGTVWLHFHHRLFRM